MPIISLKGGKYYEAMVKGCINFGVYSFCIYKLIFFTQEEKDIEYKA